MSVVDSNLQLLRQEVEKSSQRLNEGLRQTYKEQERSMAESSKLKLKNIISKRDERERELLFFKDQSSLLVSKTIFYNSKKRI